MAHDEALAARVRALLAGQPGLRERRMFGALVSMLDGNIAVGVYGAELMVRADPAAFDRLLGEPGARVSVMGRQEMPGWLLVDAQAVADDAGLRRWVAVGVAYARTLPPK